MENLRLHPDTLEEVRQRVDIVDVIGEYVVLKKRGRDYIGLCPFHDEKSPSFSVSPGKQLYYCFGCSQGGNVFKFLMELGKQSFSEVVLELAHRYQVPVKTLEPKQTQELQRQLSLKEQLSEILALTASFYQHALRQSQGETALTYLKKTRQLREETIQHFQLGYAPAGWETLYHYLVAQKRYPLNLVETAGLIKKRKNGSGYYDQFRDRLMIPIQDTQGKVIGFGSRTLGNDEPKYLNSPETPLFNKSKTLFALDKAKNSIIQQDQALVVEGYFDAIALHSGGITNVVASLGTAFTQSQIKLLLRYTESKQIIFNFDADRAGVQATQRAISEIEKLVYSGQVKLKILNIPAGKDADEFLRSSPNAVKEYQELIKNAPLCVDWQIQQLLLDKDLKKADHFQAITQQMVKILNQLEEQNQKTHYLQYCAEILSQGDSRMISLQLNNLVSQMRRPNLGKLSQNRPLSSEKSLLEEAEELLLLIYLHCPENRQEIEQLMEEKDLVFTVPYFRFLWQQILQIKEQELSNSEDNKDPLIYLLQERFLGFSEQLKKVNYLFHLNETQNGSISRPSLEIQNALTSLERVSWEKYRSYCRQQWEITLEEEGKKYYWKEFLNAQNNIKILDQSRTNQNL
jgi:DNA primase